MWRLLKNEQNEAEKGREASACGIAPELLSRFLDNDLTSGEATRIAAHLHHCLGCRHQVEAMRAHQAMLRALPTPTGANAARMRVLNRLEAAVAASREPATPKHRPILRTLRPAFALGMGCALIGGIGVTALALQGQLPKNGGRSQTATAVVRPVAAPRSLAVVATPSPAITLPSAHGVAELFALHDQQSVALKHRLAAAKVAESAHRSGIAVAASHPGSRAVIAKATHQPAAAFEDCDIRPTDGSAAAARKAGDVQSDDLPEAL